MYYLRMYMIDVYENEKRMTYIPYIYKYSCYFITGAFVLGLWSLFLYSAIKV
jgi:hypothetical protein